MACSTNSHVHLATMFLFPKILFEAAIAHTSFCNSAAAKAALGAGSAAHMQVNTALLDELDALRHSSLRHSLRHLDISSFSSLCCLSLRCRSSSSWGYAPMLGATRTRFSSSSFSPFVVSCLPPVLPNVPLLPRSSLPPFPFPLPCPLVSSVRRLSCPSRTRRPLPMPVFAFIRPLITSRSSVFCPGASFDSPSETHFLALLFFCALPLLRSVLLVPVLSLCFPPPSILLMICTVLPSLIPQLFNTAPLRTTLPSHVTCTSRLPQHALFGIRLIVSLTWALGDKSSGNVSDPATLTKNLHHLATPPHAFLLMLPLRRPLLRPLLRPRLCCPHSNPIHRVLIDLLSLLLSSFLNVLRTLLSSDSFCFIPAFLLSLFLSFLHSLPFLLFSLLHCLPCQLLLFAVQLPRASADLQR